MTTDEKIKWVRERVYEKERLNGLGFADYRLLPVEQEIGSDLDDFFAAFANGESVESTSKNPRKSVVVMTVDEQIDILQQLEKQKLIKILEQKKDSVFMEVFPPHPSPVKLKTLEHIARKLADTFTGTQLVDALLDYGIPRADIPYPDTKWRTLQNMFLALATSPNPEQREKFGGAITTFLHPLNFNADESVSGQLIDDFNKYLKYDGYEITVADDGDGYKLAPTAERKKIAPPVKPTEERQKSERAAAPPDFKVSEAILEVSGTMYAPIEEAERYSEQVEYETNMLRQPKAAEHLAVVREAYKTLIAIVSSFCADPTAPSRELNTAYGELAKVVADELKDFCGDGSEFEVFSFDEYKKNNFGIPFGSLYSAELDFKKNGRRMHWDEIRPEMNAVLGRIEDVCQTAGSPEVISDPKIQEVIGDAMLHLSKIAAQRKGADAAKTEPTVKLEITKMPELQVRNLDDAPIVKGNKRLHLPKFKPTEWAKITIRFIDERNVLITADKKEQVSVDYEALGFSDEKRSKPNSAWAFLLGLARNNGETKPLPTPIPDTIKQHKLQLASRLKAIFKNDTDPFHEPTDSRTYRIKIALIPPSTESGSPRERYELLTEDE